MRLFEKHHNGAVIDIDGEPERVVPLVIEWRKYQDSIAKISRPVGFVPAVTQEVKTNE